MQAIDLITLALLEIGVYAQGEVPSAGDAEQAFAKLNLRIDEWSARKPFAFAQTFPQFTLPVNKQPVTIGPQSADWTVAQRPQRIEGASINLNSNTPNVFVPIVIRDEQWWNYQRVPNLSSTFPTDLYYQTDFPNGSLYFWPVATQNYPVRLDFWQSIVQAPTQNTPLILPPGYANALMLTLAEDLCPSFDKDPNPLLVRNAIQARKAVQADNDGSPRIQTRESGQSARGWNKPDFNWVDGSPYGGGN